MTAPDALRARFGSLRSSDVAALDRAAADSGVTVTQLMELAGFQVARCAWALLGEHAAAVAVVAGRGNNGGDGLVAARHLATWGCTVRVCVLAQGDRLEGLSAGHAESARRNGVTVLTSTERDDVSATAEGAALVLDGILGTGLRAAPREPQAAAITAMNQSGVHILAIDVPSGMDASTGDAFDPCVHAAATCTLAAVKAGLWAPSAAAVAGRLWVADIGMPRSAWQACGLQQPTEIRAGALLSVPSATLY